MPSLIPAGVPMAADKDVAAPSGPALSAALSFILLMLVVGLPLWWQTTAVYRVALPYEDMDRRHPRVGMRVDVQVVADDELARIWTPKLQASLKGDTLHFALLSSAFFSVRFVGIRRLH